MATQKEAKVIRERVMEAIEAAGVEGMELMGRTSEGVLFGAEGEFVAVRAIVKAETFDAEAAMAELVEKEAKAAERAAAKAAKVAKAKVQKEKEIETEGEGEGA